MRFQSYNFKEVNSANNLNEFESEFSAVSRKEVSLTDTTM